jgi:acetyltransferase-like isoleucine patch superfamily enzyme
MNTEQPRADRGDTRDQKSLDSILLRVFRKLAIDHIFDFFRFYIRIFKPSRVHNCAKLCMLRLMGAKVGSGLTVYPGVWIDDPARLTLGRNVDLSKDVLITTAGGVSIGDDVLIGYGAKILSANHRIPADRSVLIRCAGHDKEPVTIGNGAWICANSVVLPGVTVGAGAIVAAGAVVTRNVPDFAVVGGVPARVLRYRGDPDTSVC